jgi:hypothetical protein
MSAPERRIVVAPSEFLPLLRDCLLWKLTLTAQDMDLCASNAEAWREPLERFDRIRAALDATGWCEHSDIDLDAHRQELQEALALGLETERSLMAEGGEAAKDQRHDAYRQALEIERFMHEAGLEIPPPEGGSDA